MAKMFETIGKLGLALAFGGGIVNSALFNGGCFLVFYLNKNSQNKFDGTVIVHKHCVKHFFFLFSI